MMFSCSVWSPKGGVGKSTLALNLASRLALEASRPHVLLVDADAQQSARTWQAQAKQCGNVVPFDVAASDAGLASVTKDTGVGASIEAARISRELGYGVTGNFLVDPDWDEEKFSELWNFVAANGFQRAGYTILTPLPGTELFQKLSPILEGQPWFKYDMHHVLWEPRLGAKRFFELYAETWRRSILNLSGQKRWSDWMRQIRPAQIPYLTRVLVRTQRMMNAQAYLVEHEVGVRAKAIQALPEGTSVASEA